MQRVARRNFRLLQDDPRHPSLHFKKINDNWVFRTGRSYRAIAIEEGPDLFWVWIGGHDEFMRIIKRNRHLAGATAQVQQLGPAA